MKRVPGKHTRQRGVILLVLILMLFTVSTTVFLSSVNTHNVQIRRHDDIRSEMERAKQALLYYAINYPSFNLDYVDDAVILDEGPGRLLCPDVDNDGLADSNSTDCTDNVRGRLPEEVIYNSGGSYITINNAFVNIDQQFWYVVSPAFKEITTSNVTDQTAGTLSIDGESGYAAVIIAPGDELPGQNRSASQTNPGNYLEQDNVSGSNFINSYSADPDAFNDQVIGIKASELSRLISNLVGDIDNDDDIMHQNIREGLYYFFLNNSGSLPADIDSKNSGKGWRWDEGYMDNAIADRIDVDTYQLVSYYPYIRYNLDGCSSRWYYFLPTYNPDITFPSGSAC